MWDHILAKTNAIKPTGMLSYRQMGQSEDGVGLTKVGKWNTMIPRDQGSIGSLVLASIGMHGWGHD